MINLNILKQAALILISILNLTTLALFYIDKKRAHLRQRRISEKTLLLSAFFLGGIGAFLGMYTFRHKTKHLKFKVLIPISTIITAMILYLLLTI